MVLHELWHMMGGYMRKRNEQRAGVGKKREAKICKIVFARGGSQKAGTNETRFQTVTSPRALLCA